MKFRTGFVSNSSTSSFLAYGIFGSEDEILECLKETKIAPEDTNSLINWCYSSDGEKLLKEKELDTWFISEIDECCIGRSFGTIKDDETGKEFKETTAKVIKELLGDKFSCDTHKEAWRDG